MIEIKVETKHFRESPGYTSTDECPLALACKDHFPDEKCIGVGGFTLYIGNTRYKIGNDWGNPDGDLDWEKINKMIDDAKKGKEIPTVTVTLTKL